MCLLFLGMCCEPAIGRCNWMHHANMLRWRSLLTMGSHFSHKNCPYPRRICTPSITCHHPSQHPNGISISSAVFARLTNVSNRVSEQATNHATPFVDIGCSLHYMWCGLIMLTYNPSVQKISSYCSYTAQTTWESRHLWQKSNSAKTYTSKLLMPHRMH